MNQLFVVYGLDIVDANKNSYIKKVLKKLGVIVIVINSSSGGGGCPECCIIGTEKNLFSWFAHENLGYDFLATSRADLFYEYQIKFEEFDLKKINKSEKDLIEMCFK